MNFEIRGANFVNKGAELMIYAVVQHINSLDPENKVAIKFNIGSINQRNRASLYHLAWANFRNHPFFSKIVDKAAGAIPKSIRSFSKILVDNEIHAVLDAAGFGYSDQWPVIQTENAADDTIRWKKEGKKIIFLPQAFGPFSSTRIQNAIKTILLNADLVFARDLDSYQNLISIHNNDNIHIAPDFTCLVEGTTKTEYSSLIGKPCFVPNSRMVDKTQKEVGREYIKLSQICLNHLNIQGLNPFILVHESNDLVIARNIQEKLEFKPEIVYSDNALELKGIIGQCSFMIGSRYHALVSALSQGVPAFGTSWSHKYFHLFNDYNFPQGLISSQNTENEILTKIDILSNADNRKEISKNLKNAAKEQQRLTLDMWRQVNQVLLAN